jgi:UDP-N-acetyl-D-galactosamine dehydrogenase
MYESLLKKEKSIAVIGLGYVGLPLALEFAKHFKVIGFDINKSRVALMQQGIDPSNELDKYRYSFHNRYEGIKKSKFFHCCGSDRY